MRVAYGVFQEGTKNRTVHARVRLVEARYWIEDLDQREDCGLWLRRQEEERRKSYLFDAPRERSHFVRGLPYRTSAEKGEGVKKHSKFANKQYRFCRQRGGEGVTNTKILWTPYMEAP